MDPPCTRAPAANDTRISLEVFDVAGRRRARPLDGEIVAAGEQEVRVSTSSWPAGVYFVRLASAAETTKLVVFH